MKVLLSITLLLTFASASFGEDLPTQVHIALAGGDAGGNSNGMAVSWNTVKQTPTTTVKYGLQAGNYDKSATGTSSAYYETFNHHAIMENLSPATEYHYIVGDDTEGWSQDFSFKSAPLSSNLHSNFSFIIYGDLGVYNGDPTRDYINSVKDKVELVWHAGDASYADDSFLHEGCVAKFCYEDTLDTYMKSVEPWTSKLPYMVTPGNHEADCHDPACLTSAERREKLSNFTAFNNRFRMPSPESGGVLNMHYSFNYGSVHFISLDSETGYPGAALETRYVLPCGGFGDQLTWLEQDLIKANSERDVRPWILAAGHRPIYQGSKIDKDFQAAVEDLFYQYGVDVYFAGHVHSYERDLPVYQVQPQLIIVSCDFLYMYTLTYACVHTLMYVPP